MRLLKLKVKNDFTSAGLGLEYKLEIPLTYGFALLSVPYLKPEDAEKVKKWIDVLVDENIDKEELNKKIKKGYEPVLE